MEVEHSRFRVIIVIYQSDKEFIEHCLDSYASNINAKDLMRDVAQEPPFLSKESGVPPAMFDGEVDAEGWVQWKMLPSTLTEDDVIKIEAILPGQFPPLFRAYLIVRFTMSIETSKVRLPSLPCDNPFEDLLSELRAWSSLFASGYVAFAKDGNDAGPLCFDFQSRLSDGDCPIVLFDHEHLINLGEDLCAQREKVVPYAEPVFESFRELLKTLGS